MKTQLKKGLLEVCVLSALVEEDSYGYKLIQNTEKIIEISESTLYPILRRLEKNQYLDSYNVEYNGRLRKYYHITDAGIDYIKQFMKEWNSIYRVYRFIKEKIDYE